jgi:hypothetical protein
LLGTFISYAGVTVWWTASLLHHEFGTPLKSLASAVFRPLLLAVPYAFGLRLLTTTFPPTSWLMLAVWGSGSVLGFLALSWCLVLTRAERQLWVHRVKSLWGGNR